jgi:hypothetical protein
MKVINILLLTLIVGVCWASPADNLVPWTPTTTKVIHNVPYKIDTNANFSNATMSSVKTNLRHPSRSLDVKYVEAKDESSYLLITSYEKCIENRKNNFCHSGNIVLVCVETHSKEEIKSATKFALEMNKRA